MVTVLVWNETDEKIKRTSRPLIPAKIKGYVNPGPNPRVYPYIKLLPKLENIEIQTIEIKNERDVEIYLLEPLLEKLGYSQQDWKRQLKVRMGRREKIIPDYVIFPIKKREMNQDFGYLRQNIQLTAINS